MAIKIYLTLAIFLFFISCKKENQMPISSESISNATATFETMQWTVQGIQRTAWVHWPTKKTGSNSILFVFHGHGSSGLELQKEIRIENYWSSAIVVYPDGLPTQSHGDPDGSGTGWQHAVGEVNPNTGIKDQDVKFYDAMLATFKGSIDENKIFVHGRSNGAEFTFDVLWTLGKPMKAFCSASAINNSTSGKQPIPMMHIAGTADPKVSFQKQKDATAKIRTLDQCSNNGTIWKTGPYGITATKYHSGINSPVIFMQYNGGHVYPKDEVPPLVVDFFKGIIDGTIN
jgi:poly(3-hydroxybutyrate) depolymerase